VRAGASCILARMTDLIEALFRQNEWANLRLIAACRDLTEAQLDATEVGAYGSIRGTWMHLVSGEARYVQHLGGATAPPFRSQDPWVGFDRLETAVRDNAAGLIERARAADGVVRAHFDVDDEADIDPAVILVQAINHGAEHRGQICTILTSLGVQPPEIDGWSWGDATGRIRPVSG
jgi:uncharacterized damage-inducible protein DinB